MNANNRFMNYTIANIRVSLPDACTGEHFTRALRPFLTLGAGPADLALEIVPRIPAEADYRELDIFEFPDADADCRFGTDAAGYLLEMTPRDGSAPARYRMAYGAAAARSDITPGHNPALFRFGVWILFNIAALPLGAVAFHSSVIRYRGRGVLFLGESGTGKSTHAAVAGAYPGCGTAQRRQSDHPGHGQRSPRPRIAVERQNALLPQRELPDSRRRTALASPAQPHPPPAADRVHRSVAPLRTPGLRPRRTAFGRHLRPALPADRTGSRLPPGVPARRGGGAARLPNGFQRRDAMILLPNQLFFAEVEAMLAEGREVQIRMKGHSMRPLLRSERDQVVLTPCTDPARLRPGDVVLFRCCGRHILHRIVRRDGDRLTLAGDGNYRITEQCTTRDVAGIAVRVIRASGRVVGCDSPGWRLRSRLWLAIPPWLRRQVLRVLWHSGWK